MHILLYRYLEFSLCLNQIIIRMNFTNLLFSNHQSLAIGEFNQGKPRLQCHHHILYTDFHGFRVDHYVESIFGGTVFDLFLCGQHTLVNDIFFVIGQSLSIIGQT